MEIVGKSFVKIFIFEPYKKFFGHWILLFLKLEVTADPPFVSVKVKPTLSLAMSIRCMLHQVCSCPIVKMFYNGLISSFESIPPNECFCLIWTQLQVTFIYIYPLFCLPEKWSGLRKKTFVPTGKKLHQMHSVVQVDHFLQSVADQMSSLACWLYQIEDN